MGWYGVISLAPPASTEAGKAVEAGGGVALAEPAEHTEATAA
jgi:hypothetical protein